MADKHDESREYDREPEPPDDPSPALDIDAARAVYRAMFGEALVLGANGMKALDLLPVALDEVEVLRKELAYWRSLEIREEFLIVYGGDAGSMTVPAKSADEALTWAAKSDGAIAYMQPLTVHALQELSNEPPF